QRRGLGPANATVAHRRQHRKQHQRGDQPQRGADGRALPLGAAKRGRCLGRGGQRRDPAVDLGELLPGAGQQCVLGRGGGGGLAQVGERRGGAVALVGELGGAGAQLAGGQGQGARQLRIGGRIGIGGGGHGPGEG